MGSWACYYSLIIFIIMTALLYNSCAYLKKDCSVRLGHNIQLVCSINDTANIKTYFWYDIKEDDIYENYAENRSVVAKVLSTYYTERGESLKDHYYSYSPSKDGPGNVSSIGTLTITDVGWSDETNYLCFADDNLIVIVYLEITVPVTKLKFISPTKLPALLHDQHTLTLQIPETKPLVETSDLSCFYNDTDTVPVDDIISSSNTTNTDGHTYQQQWAVTVDVNHVPSSLYCSYNANDTIEVTATLHFVSGEVEVTRTDTGLSCSLAGSDSNTLVNPYTYKWECVYVNTNISDETFIKNTTTIDLSDTSDAVSCTCVISNGNTSINATETFTYVPKPTAEKQSSNIAVIAGAGGGGAAIIIIVVVIVVVVCLLRRNKTDDKAKRSDSQDECPYVVSGRAPLAGQNQYNSNDNRPPPQSPLYASTEVAKQGYNNGAMTPLSNVSTDDEGAPTAYGNIQPKVAAVDPAVIYSEPHKQKKQKKGNKNRKSDPIQEYANINNQLTDKQKGQYKQPDGTIYTEVSIDNNPSSAPGGSNSNAAAVNIRRRPDNPPTEYARVDFVKTKGGPGAADEGAAAAAPASPVYAEPAAVAAPPARDSDPPPAPPTKPPRLPQL